MIANYHTHTTRCKHAIGSDREYVENAIRGGIKVLGFSDHCPWIYDREYESGTRMLPRMLAGYVDNLQKLKKEYEKDIKIYIGLEAEYIPEMMPKQDILLKDYPLDYMILGEHFTEVEYDTTYTGFETTSEAALEKYVDISIEGLESGRYVYMAHPDLLNFVGPTEIYDRHYIRLCEYMKMKNMPVEINMLGLIQGRHYPNDRFFELCKEVGNSVIIGFDAHDPSWLSDVDYMKRCEEYARVRGLEVCEVLPGLR